LLLFIASDLIVLSGSGI